MFDLQTFAFIFILTAPIIAFTYFWVKVADAVIETTTWEK